MIGRNEVMMHSKLEKLKAKNGKKLKTMAIVANFAELNTIAQYKLGICKKIEHIDVGMLVLNAGLGYVGPIKRYEECIVEDMVNINVGHVTYLLQTMLPKLL